MLIEAQLIKIFRLYSDLFNINTKNCHCDKKKPFSPEKEADKCDLEFGTPVEEFKVPFLPHFLNEKTSSETSCATISTVSSAANQYKILDPIHLFLPSSVF